LGGKCNSCAKGETPDIREKKKAGRCITKGCDNFGNKKNNYKCGTCNQGDLPPPLQRSTPTSSTKISPHSLSPLSSPLVNNPSKTPPLKPGEHKRQATTGKKSPVLTQLSAAKDRDAIAFVAAQHWVRFSKRSREEKTHSQDQKKREAAIMVSKGPDYKKLKDDAIKDLRDSMGATVIGKLENAVKRAEELGGESWFIYKKSSQFLQALQDMSTAFKEKNMESMQEHLENAAKICSDAPLVERGRKLMIQLKQEIIIIVLPMDLILVGKFINLY